MNAPGQNQKATSTSCVRLGRILVVDDEELMQGLLREMLGAAGYEVLTASGGKEAVVLFLKDQSDLIIADIVMPGMDGIAVLQAVKDVDPDVPVIMITGYPSEDTEARLINLGATAYITKPFEANVMKSTVAKALEMRKYGDARQENLRYGG